MTGMRVVQRDQHEWLASAVPRECHFYNQRPDPQDISLLVIHCISLPRGCYRNQMVQQFFGGYLSKGLHPELDTIADMQVSAHLFIDRIGDVFQFVPFDQRAWHAGVSTFAGRHNCNDFSIGIELEGVDDGPFTWAQYQSLGSVTKTLCTYYSQLVPDRIVGHSDIAPDRKTDPGSGFDWRYYRQLLQSA
ncbi:1,6-anhydro-N-acetylmuramyl-L-alanine amidase AmpD [Celerinatantimonas sp. YJH-8]|uniref:1,6-anhydro-N-acetylmuramyl-L-alanine amidase AmpD n=1 Tax=Celerinatantimonas sp. YJH-8 TaxID=3228714 RepID=UPI0038CA08F3